MPIGFYDEQQQVNFPHPPISLPVLLVVERALCAAWNLLRTRPRSGFNLLTALEDEITHELYEALFDGVFNTGMVEGFDRQLFFPGGRESKLRSYDFKSLDKMPDLLIGLIGRPSGIKSTQDGLFIECKPVDVAHSVRTDYCNRGLVRFIRGEYAWAMTNAMMVGYARHGYTISPKLADVLKSPPRGISSTGPLRPCRRSTASTINDLVHSSQHARKFKYRESGQAARPITIRHLWLKRD